MTTKKQPTGEERYESPEILDIQPVTVKGEGINDGDSTLDPEEP